MTMNPSALSSVNKGFLESQALDLLNQNLVTESFQIFQEQSQQQVVIPSETVDTDAYSYTDTSSRFDEITRNTISYVYPTPCSATKSKPVLLQESTCTLLSALSLAKDNRTSLAWETLRSLFVVQGSNGFLPKYRYGANPENLNGVGSFGNKNGTVGSQSYWESDRDSHYIPQTSFPSPNMFAAVPDSYQSCPPDGEGKDNFKTDGRNSDLPLSCLDANGDNTMVQQLGIRGSGRLAAVPYHATIILQIFAQSEQTPNDINQLVFYFARLYKMHRFWMERVMRDCFESTISTDSVHTHRNRGRQQQQARLHDQKRLKVCYNVLHPWESMVDLASPLWQTALDPIIRIMKQSNWIPPIQPLNDGIHSRTSTTVSNLIPSNETIHNAMLYITQCHKNATLIHLKQQHHQKGTGSDNKVLQNQYEQILLRSCPFAMLDVSHVSALSRANADLYQIGSILKRYKAGGPVTSTEYQMENVQTWVDLSHRLLMDLYYVRRDGGGDDGGGGSEVGIDRGFFSKSVQFEVDNDTVAYVDRDDNKENNVHYRNQPGRDKFVVEPSAFQLLAGWDYIPEYQVFENGIVSPLLEHNGGDNHRFVFGCGVFPIVSWGDWCRSRSATTTISTGKESSLLQDYTSSASAWIYPVLNYMVSDGLIQNEAKGLGIYLQNSTLRMVCNVSNLYLGDIDDVCGMGENSSRQNITFASAYRATTATPTVGETRTMPSIDYTSLDTCDLTSTLTAVIVHNTLIPSRPLDYRPEPPIRHEWVLALIVAELAVALGIGLSCLILSVNLMKRLRRSRRSGEAGNVLMTDSDCSFFSLLEDDNFDNFDSLYDEDLDDIIEDYNDASSTGYSINNDGTTGKSHDSSTAKSQGLKKSADEEEEEKEKEDDDVISSILPLTNIFRSYQS